MPENAPAKPAAHLSLVTSTEGDTATLRCSGKLVTTTPESSRPKSGA